MLETLSYGLYVTAIGMGGVFVVLSIIALFMWCMRKSSRFIKERKIEEGVNVSNNKIDEKELFAIIMAAYTYHVEQNRVFPILTSKNWKNAAKTEVLR